MFCQEDILRDSHCLCMRKHVYVYECVCMCVSVPSAPNCICGAESGSSLAAGEVCHCYSPNKAQRAQPSPALPRISKGAVSKSNRTLLHRIPLVTQFRFMQAHSVGHFHSLRKRGQASFSLQNPAAFVGNSVYLHFVAQFIPVKEDVRREMQVRRYPKKRSAAAQVFSCFLRHLFKQKKTNTPLSVTVTALSFIFTL